MTVSLEELEHNVMETYKPEFRDLGQYGTGIFRQRMEGGQSIDHDRRDQCGVKRGVCSKEVIQKRRETFYRYPGHRLRRDEKEKCPDSWWLGFVLLEESVDELQWEFAKVSRGPDVIPRPTKANPTVGKGSYS